MPCLDMSIFRAGWVRAGLKKNSVISARKNHAHDHPIGRIGPQFLGWARAGPGLGRAARAFYSVKQLKTTFRAGLGPKKIFAGFKISAHACPLRFAGGPGAGPGRACGPGSKCSGIAMSSFCICGTLFNVDDPPIESGLRAVSLEMS
jgi:hypothetical protein